MTTTEPATGNGATPTSQAVEKVDNSPRGMIANYRDSFTQVLPSHIAKPETWVRLAQGALKKGRRVADGRTELEVAAANNPGVFLSALLDCARLGLEPGTEQYYLTPRKVKGQLEILGIVGYQGLVELMYRAGAISSVVAECVYEHDEFSYRPGVDERPVHEIDWDLADRGGLRLVYAYARMRDGATSKVVVLNRHSIERIKRSAQGSDSQYSPWVTNEPAMWLKSAVRQLVKWVPTSSEYRNQVAPAPAEQHQPVGPTLDLPVLDSHGPDDEIFDAEIFDAEIVEVDDEPADDVDPVDDSQPAAAAGVVPMNDGQSRAVQKILRDLGITGDDRFPWLTDQLEREITTTKQISYDEAAALIERHMPLTGDAA